MAELLRGKSGKSRVKKLSIAVALCGSLICSPVHAKTFVGVLWPLFGPPAAMGLAELAAELRMMPDVEVATYMHQSWPSLVEDIDRQPEGTRIAVIGYSLGANSSVFVANKAKHVDLIVALQPSMFSWNPSVTGNVGKMIEVYNPNPLMTFGGMGSKKLVGPNIEYIANNDSHPGAQFNLEFRSLVKKEIAKLSAGNDLVTAQADIPKPPARPKPEPKAEPKPEPDVAKIAANDHLKTAQAETPHRATAPKPEAAADERPKHQPKDMTAFLDTLSGSVNSGDLQTEPRLTRAEMMAYAKRTYRLSRTADNFSGRELLALSGDVTATAAETRSP